MTTKGAAVRQGGKGTSPTAGDSGSSRLFSLDAFRGLVILTMIFVNYLAGVGHIPAWAKHTPDKVDGYTIVDLVFPGFLFIVGVAIPIALHKRMASGASIPGLVARVLMRSASLIFMGFVMVNEETFSEQATGVSYSAWFFIAMTSMVAIWTRFIPEARPGAKKWLMAFKVAALVALACALFIFRGKPQGGHATWMQHSWWGILGMIGWAYLTCSLIYLACGGSSLALMGMLGFMIALFIGDKHGVLEWLGPVSHFIGVGEVFGTTSASVMTGVLVGNCFFGPTPMAANWQRVRFMLVFGLGLYASGMLMRPLHGIIKNEATDAYTLVAGGLCCLGFLVVYLLMDVLKLRAWAAPLIPVGQSALFAYFLPGILDYFFDMVRAGHWIHPYDSGGAGAINSAVLTVIVLAITWAAHRCGLRFNA